MSDHAQTVLRDLGLILHVPGVMALGSVVVCLIFVEHYAIVPLLLTSAVSIGAGQALYRVFREAAPMRVSHAMVTAVLSWALVAMLGALPFVLIAGRLQDLSGATDSVLVFGHGWNAVFESISGFTSTGLTMAVRPSELPHSLQWWRTLSQWIGGVGIIVLTLSILHPSEDSRRLYFAEAGEESPVASLGSVTRGIWTVYVAYTLVSILALRLAGLAWWPAINYGMAGIATGGFGVADDSMAAFGPGAQTVMLLVILAGAISFSVHVCIVRDGDVGALWKDTESRTLFWLVAAGGILLALENGWSQAPGSPFGALFQWSSALATAGFSTESIQPWSASAKLLLCLAMTCGGAAGATTGGLRIRRIRRLAEGAGVRIIGVARHPWRLMDRKPIADPKAEHHAARQLEAAVTLLVLWVVAIVGGTVLLLHAVGSEARLEDVLFEVTSALNNVGLTTGITSPDLSTGGKLGLMLLMFVGRLEIVPVLVICTVGWSTLTRSRSTRSA